MLHYSNSILLSFSAEVNASIITFIATLIVAAFSIHQNYLTRRDNKKNISRVDLIEKKLVIENKLNEFYIPLRHHLENSKTLFKILKKGKPDKFRTLTYLLDREQKYGEGKVKVELSKNDKSLIKAIIRIGKKIEKLVYEKSYLIGDDIEFVKEYVPRKKYEDIFHEKEMTLLSLLTSHLVTIRMAYKGDLSGQKEKFEGFVFPNEINIRVNEKIDQLESEIIFYDSEILKLNT
jgi:hypothetical protein